MKLMVLDGNSIVNRAFYGVSQNLTTRDGQPTNAIYGFINILDKLLNEENPDALCVTFDRRAPTFRHLAYAGYKATRKGMPEELASQMPILKEVLSAMNIPMYEMDGWEADDLLGTIARIDTEQDWDTVIVTGDRDALQLVTDRTTVKLVSTRMGQTTTRAMTPESFQAEYGFPPVNIIDLKALMGDSSDNIPGVTGIGEKTAMPLITLYHTVEALYEQMPDVCTAPGTKAKPGVIKKLAAGKDQCMLSKDLATIRTSAPIEFQPRDCLRKEPDSAALYQLFLKLEFARLIDRYHLSPPQGETQAAASEFSGITDSETVTDPARALELLEQWKALPQVSVLALPSLDAVCVVSSSGESRHGALLFSDRLENYSQVLQQLFSGEISKVSHGVKSLHRKLLEEGISPGGFVFDTELAAYLLAPTDGSYDLEKLGLSWFNREFPKAKTYLAEGAFDSLFAAQDSGAEQEKGEGSDPAGAFLSHTALVSALQEPLTKRLKELGMWDLFQNIELPLCAVLAEMETEGFLIDRNALADFGTMLSGKIDLSQKRIYELAGEEFNINSTAQLGRILFEKLGLPPDKKTRRGYSTSADVLEKLRDKHPIVEEILQYRQLTKLKSTYVDGFMKLIPADCRIHTSFQNTVTATGRLSSTEPNLQNIPVRTELGAEMRRMFAAPPGRVLVDADYSQIELRLLACISGDEAMIEGFSSGADVHAITASQVFGVPLEEVTPAMRRSAKAVNFGIVYGISAYSLSQDIGVTVAEAKDYMSRYFAHYAGVRRYMTDVVNNARRDGYITTLYGRRRWIPELKSSNFNTRSFGERVALNAPIQGTAADIIKIAMLRVRDRLQKEGLQGRLVLQVHDELIVECPESEAEAVAAVLREEMESAASLPVALVAETSAGRTWADAH